MSAQPRPASWIRPSGLDLLFVVLLAWLFLLPPQGWERLLQDGDTGWHIRAGDWMLAHHQVPRVDLFSFSKPGEPWFAWEWGADVLYSLLHSRFGLKGIVLLAGVQIALFATLLCGYLMWRGSNTFFAIALVLMAVRAASVHYSARPHLFTLWLVPLTLWMIEADRRKPTWRIWLLVPLTAVWTNLHGGVMALPPMLLLLAGGSALESLWSGEHGSARWTAAQRYLALTIGCTAATLINPYGWELHRHVFAYLDSDWIRDTIVEFQSPKFRSESMLHYELLLLSGLMAAAAQLSRRRIVEALWILFWAHESLASARHLTIYVTVATPVVAAELTRIWDAAVAGAAKTSVRHILDSVASDFAAGMRWASVWPVIGLLGLLLGIVPSSWPIDFPSRDFPREIVARNGERLQRARVFTTDTWASYLIYKNSPGQRVFFDGRSDFYGPQVGRDYVNTAAGKTGWNAVLQKYGIDLVLAEARSPLAAQLNENAGWRKIDGNKESVLFEHVTQFRRSEGKAGAQVAQK